MREEEKQNSKLNESKWQRLLRKRWVFPAIYIASAAIILTGVLWFQSSGGNEVEAPEDQYSYEGATDNDQAQFDQEAVEVTATPENFKMPVYEGQGIVVQKPFYDYDASTEDQEAALVFYNNTYYPNTGIDYAMENGESFDVIASLSGTVVKVEEDSLLGNKIKIEHENGVATHYSSLGEVHVEEGQQIDQGSVIGTAGRNVYNADAGVHVHFEIRQDDQPVNPIDYINQPLSSLFEGEDGEAAEKEQASKESEEKDADSGEQPADPSNEKKSEQPAEPSNQEEPGNKPEQPADEKEEQPGEGSEEEQQTQDASLSMTRA